MHDSLRSTNIIPVSQINRRMPQQGRIRMGEKKGNRPVALDNFRLTSTDQVAIGEIAQRYGGVPQPWAGAPRGNEWEVTIKAASLPITLPPDPLGGGPVYELWSGGGCQRRCDGETCEVPSPEGITDTGCICMATNQMACKPIVRLNVILREIRFGGVWMVEAHGWNAFHELPGMVEMIAMMQARGLTRAELSLEKRLSKKNGRTSHFVVPVVRLADSVEALIAGNLSMMELHPGTSPVSPQALMAGVAIGDDDEDQDEPVDAEIIDLQLPLEPAAPAEMKMATAEELEAIDARVRVQVALSGLADQIEVDPAGWLASKLRLVASKGEWTTRSTIMEESWWANLVLILGQLETGTVGIEVVPSESGPKLKLQALTRS